MGAVTTERTAVPGCRVHPPSVMRYLPVASRSYVERYLPAGFTASAAEVLRHWNTRQLSSAREPLDHRSDESGESPASAFRRLRLEMLDVERSTFIAERDSGKIDDELLRELLIGLDLEEATLRRD
jgi:hypothetical protein